MDDGGDRPGAMGAQWTASGPAWWVVPSVMGCSCAYIWAHGQAQKEAAVADPFRQQALEAFKRLGVAEVLRVVGVTLGEFTEGKNHPGLASGSPSLNQMRFLRAKQEALRLDTVRR